MKEVVVIGVRSGTSLTTGILFNLGVFMGDVIFGANAYNERGYFEDADFALLINKIYLDMEGSKLEPPDSLGRVSWGLIEEFRRHIKSHRRDLWGFKAGGGASLIPIYDALLDNPHYIVCNRNPIEVASSSMRVEEHYDSVPEGFDWFKYAKKQMNMGLELTEGRKRLVLEFHETIDNTRETIDKISKFLDIKPSKKQIKSAMAFVSPELRHNKI